MDNNLEDFAYSILVKYRDLADQAGNQVVRGQYLEAYKLLEIAVNRALLDNNKNTIEKLMSSDSDEIKIATVLVGLRDFSDRSDYCPKAMKEKLSECIKDLQTLYHANTITMPREGFEQVKEILIRVANTAWIKDHPRLEKISGKALEILKQYEVK